MKHNINISMILILSLFGGATYAASSLWGDIDESQAKPPVVAAPKATTKTITAGVPVATAESVALPEKTTCEILKSQVALDPNIMRSPAIQDAMRNYAQNAPARYKGVLSSTSGINAVFVLYRSEYLKKYCN